MKQLNSLKMKQNQKYQTNKAKENKLRRLFSGNEERAGGREGGRDGEVQGNVEEMAEDF